MRGSKRLTALAALALGLTFLVGASFAAAQTAKKPKPPHPAKAAKKPGGGAKESGCPSGTIKHVVFIQFDNTHLLRDRPNVPSDLEQMPHLLNFIRSNGTLLTNDHTVLISHTAGGILSTLTGVYPDRHGQAVSNSFRYFNPTGTSSLGVSFAYWTDGIFDPNNATPTDTSYNMVTETGKNAPAPWVPFTRAGCNVGAVATANTVLENIGPDVPKVFGPASPEAAEVKANPNQAFADFVGLAVHCAQGASLCSTANHGAADVLPDEPGGYTRFNGLFGSKYVQPVISPAGAIADINGNPIKDPAGNVGFPGFDGVPAAVSLGYVAAMQEHGIPVTYAYISDAHDQHTPNAARDTFVNSAYGPGEAGYVAALKAYDDAFAKFFARLAADGITKANTEFVFTVDEGDHFAGGQSSTSGCDGVTTPCAWSHVTCPTATTPTCPSDDVGEVNGNLRGLLATQRGNTTPFQVHSDSAPAIYLDGNPARDAAVTRKFAQDVAALTATNPYTGQNAKLTKALANSAEMKTLHMVTGDPLRKPTLVQFADPDYFLFAGAANCSAPCVQVQPGFAWNHGDITPDIASTWLGFVGPGVRHLGSTAKIWSDHTDVRPTMLSLLGLKDDYVPDGRVLIEALDAKAVPQSLRAHRETLQRLGAVYKQINAPFGELGMATLGVSTTALSSDDATYTRLENAIQALTNDRDALAARMRTALDDAAFGNQALSEKQAKQLIKDGEALLARARSLAAQSG